MNQAKLPTSSGDELPVHVRRLVEETVRENYPLLVGSMVDGERVAVSQVFSPDDVNLERARKLRVVELYINPETPEGQKMIEQMCRLHDECCVPKEVLRQFRAGGDRALRNAFKHGGMPDKSHPDENEARIYARHQMAYLSPRDMLLHQLSNDRPGSFHVLALTDSTKNPDTEIGDYLQGYISFRMPPESANSDALTEYRAALEETLSVRTGHEEGNHSVSDMKYVDNWDMAHMHQRLIKMLELDTIIVKRGNRKCGGPFILIDALDKFVTERCGKSVTKVFCSVFAGFTDYYSVHHQNEGEEEDDDNDDPNLVRLQGPIGRNIGSADFFERDLLFTQFAVRRTPNEVIVRDIGEGEDHDYAVFEPHWAYLYNSLKRIRRQLEQSQILKRLGLR